MQTIRAEVIGVVVLIGQKFAQRSGRSDQGVSHGDVGQIAWAQRKDAGPASFIYQTVDLGGATASRAAYSVNEAPLLRLSPSGEP